MHRRLARTPALSIAALALTLVTAGFATGTTSAEPGVAVPVASTSVAPAGAASTTVAAGERVAKKKAKKHRHKKRKNKGSKPARPTTRPTTRPPVTTSTTAPTGNPLVGRTWGVYKGRAEMAWQPYVDATGADKELLAKIALRPKAKWFGDWISLGDVTRKVTEYIENSQAGDPTALVQMTVFRMKPWEHEACKRLPTAAEQAAYKQWTDRFAAAIGSTPTAIVLQPDGPFALCAPGGSSLPSSLVAYSAKVFSALPRTSVYIEAGAADWPAPGSRVVSTPR